jgi:choline dehydrogenase
VRIESADPSRAPLIDHRYNTRERDCDRFGRARDFFRDMLAAPAFHRLGAEWLDDMSLPISDALAEGLGTAHHQAGTARMGPATDAPAVVGVDLKVHSFDNLRVADTSVYPDKLACALTMFRKGDDLVSLGRCAPGSSQIESIRDSVMRALRHGRRFGRTGKIRV